MRAWDIWIDRAGRGLTVVGGVSPSGRGLAGRAVLLNARVRGDGREDGDSRVVSVRVPAERNGSERAVEVRVGRTSKIAHQNQWPLRFLPEFEKAYVSWPRVGAREEARTD